MVSNTYSERSFEAPFAVLFREYWWGLWWVLVSPVPALADVIEIRPSVAGADCVEEFEQVANRLKPGDTLVLRGGRYEQSCRRALSIQGTHDRPITIRAAHGEQPVLTRPDSNRDTENNIEFVDTHHVTLRGLEFAGGSIGVRLIGSTSHFELADSTIRDTGNNAFAANTGDSDHLYLHHNTIHSTGQSPGQTEGEGFYLGCHGGNCRTTDSRIEYNTLYNLNYRGAGGNDGIEIKPGSGGNLVAYNRIVGRRDRSDFPCILSYGGGADVNVIENNILQSCNEAIQVVRDAVVRGNVIDDSLTAGIIVRRHNTVGAPGHVSIVNNTVINSQRSSTCLKLGLWRARNVHIHNNALVCEPGVAISGTWLRRADFASNWASGRFRGVPLTFTGITTANKLPSIQRDRLVQGYVPSQLKDAGLASELVSGSKDRNGIQRPQGSGIDIGAFESTDPD